MGDAEITAIGEVIHSGQIAQGPKVAEFEEAFAALIEVEHAVAVSSGTSALLIALLAHGVGRGDWDTTGRLPNEVVTTPFSFIATANTIRLAGAWPKFADIEPTYYNLDPQEIRAQMSPSVKALLPVHLYGHPANMDAIVEIAQEYGLPIIEDCAQAVGATWRGQPVGSFGTGCFSFYATKNMTTGEGGMITTNDADIAERCRLLRSHGAAHEYNHLALGFNMRMTDIQAALGLAQLEKLQEFNYRRHLNAAKLTGHLREVVGTPAVDGRARHAWHQYTIRVRTDREWFIEHLHRQGVQAKVFYPTPIHKQPLYANRFGYEDVLPVAELAAREVVSLPVHPGVTDGDLGHILRVIGEVLNG